jgi:hypothetical protein
VLPGFRAGFLMTISVVQSNTTVGPANGTFPGTFTSGVAAGNTLFMVVFAYDSGSAISATTPTFNGLSYPAAVQLYAIYSTSGSNIFTAAWMFPNVPTAGATSVGLTLTGGTNDGNTGQIVYEVSGLGASPLADQTVTQAVNSGGSTTASVTTPAIQFQPEFVLASSIGFGQSQSGVPGAPWTNLSAGNNDYAAAGYQVVTSSGGTYTWQGNTGSGGTSGDSAAGIVTIAGSAGSGPVLAQQPGSRAWRGRFRRVQVPWPSPATVPAPPVQPPALLKGSPAAVRGRLAGLAAPVVQPPGSGPPPQPQPGARVWRARFRRHQVPFGPPGPPPASVPAPFTLPQIARGPAARSLARLTAARGRPGAPAPFTPPHVPVRGPAGRVLARLTGARGRPGASAPFTAPHVPVHGPPAAVKGKLAGLTAPPPVAPPARTPVQAPAGLFRGRTAARPGKLTGLAALVPARVTPPAGPPRAVPPLLKGPPAATRGQLGFWRVRVFAQLFTASGSWTGPSGLAGLPAVYTWGPAGSSVAGVFPVSNGAAGGGGAFGGEPALGGVGPGTVLTVTVGTAGSGTATTVTGGTVTVTAAAGGNGIGTSGGGGGSPGSNTLAEGGGSGGGATGGTDGGGGGASGGSTGAGGAGQAGVIGGLGGSAGTGAAGPPSLAGGTGGNGATPSAVAQNGAVPGAAGGGGCSASGFTAAGTSQDGLALIVWTAYDLPAVTAAPGRALPGAVTGSQIVTVSVAPGPAAPFTAPRTLLRGPAGRVLARLTGARGRPGVPALFAVPGVLLRGRAAARAGKLAGIVAPPPVLHPAVISVFKLPGSLRGPASAVKGTVAGIVAPPPVLHPAVVSTFKVPGLPLRGPAAARKGSVTGVVAPPPVTQPNIPSPFYPPHLPLRGPVPVTPRTKTTGGVAPPPVPPPVAPPHWQGSTHMIAATATGNLIQGANHTGRGGPGTDLKGDYERSGD